MPCKSLLLHKPYLSKKKKKELETPAPALLLQKKTTAAPSVKKAEKKPRISLPTVETSSLFSSLKAAHQLLQTIHPQLPKDSSLSAPDASLLDRINQLGIFEEDWESYATVAKKLDDLFRSYKKVCSKTNAKIRAQLLSTKRKIDRVWAALSLLSFNQGNLSKSRKEAAQLASSASLKPKIFSTLTQAHLNKHQAISALACAKSIPSGQQRQHLIVKIAQFYFDLGLLKTAFSLLQSLSCCQKQQALLLQIAQVHLAKGKLKEALAASSFLIFGSEKEKLLWHIAQTLFNQEDFKAALNAIKWLPFSKTKEDFIWKIVHKFFDKGCRKSALKAIQLLPPSQAKEDFIRKIAQLEHKKGHLQQSVNAIQVLTSSPLSNKNETEKLALSIVETHIQYGLLKTALELLQYFPTNHQAGALKRVVMRRLRREKTETNKEKSSERKPSSRRSSREKKLSQV